MNKKTCTGCKVEKDIDSFSKNPTNKDGRNYKCKSCQSKYLKKHYAKNKQYYIDKSKESKDKYRIAKNKIIAEAKKDGCVKCGEKHPATLDFHHVDEANKSFTISRRYSKGIQALKDEIAKCIVLCSNCHRKEHWKE